MIADNFLKEATRENVVEKTIEYLNNKFSELGFKLVNAQLTTVNKSLTPKQLNRFKATGADGRLHSEPNEDGTYTHTWMPETPDYDTLSLDVFDE